MFPLSEQAEKALRLLHGHGYEAYIVGGCVRDFLLGMQPKDIDITTNAEPPQIKSVFSSFQTVDTGVRHGTVTVLIDGKSFEITTYRIDLGYSDGRHPDAVRFTPSLYEDAARRDFTMNALAYNSEEGLVDYFGGAADIRAKTIRCVGEPARRFQEDALRILRALRFASTLGSLQRRISAERVTEELRRLLCGAHAESVLCRYSAVLFPCLPELQTLDARALRLTAAVCGNVRPFFPLRLAALFCRLSSEAASAALARLRIEKKERAYVSALLARFADVPDPARPAVRRLLGELSSQLFFDLIALKRADCTARDDEKTLSLLVETERCATQVVSDGDCCTLHTLAVRGADFAVLGIRGAAVGRLLKALLDAVIDGRMPNDRAVLIRYAAGLCSEAGTFSPGCAGEQPPPSP